LANIKNLQELIINGAKGSLTELFRAFALKSESKLQELHALTNLCSDDIREIWRIKSLRKLNMFYERVCNNFNDLDQLIELQSLRIVRPFWERVHIESVFPIFKSCQNLQCATFEGDGVATNLASNIYKILRTSRDPLLQEPLQLFIIEHSPFPNFHVSSNDNKSAHGHLQFVSCRWTILMRRT